MSVLRPWTIGTVRVSRILEFEMGLLEPEVLYPGISSEVVARHRHWLEPVMLEPATGRLVLSIHSFVIQTPSHIVLVDACSGNDKMRPHKTRYHMKSWPYLENLAAAGYRPDDIDIVLCTHLHADHVGWNTRLLGGRWIPTFPRARYLFAREEWEYWRVRELRERYTGDPYYEDSLLPVIESGRADFVSMDHVIDDHVALEPSPGHTPGHVCVRIRSGGAEAVMSGDLMHTALQCAEPDLNSCFCIDLEHSRRTRRVFLERHADTSVLIMPAHFPTPAVGWIRRHGDTFRFRFEP